MKKILALAAGATLALGCSMGSPNTEEPTPIPQDTRNHPPGPSPSTSAEQKCVDDDLAAVRKMAKDQSTWVRPESCKALSEDRFWEVHRLVLLKFEANG